MLWVLRKILSDFIFDKSQAYMIKGWVVFAAILTISVSFFVNDDSDYSKVIHDTDPDALCLDGSHPALYVHQGSEPSKILIVVSGGGFCQSTTVSGTIQQCYDRSKTDLGSSKNLKDQFIGPEILSTDPSNKMAEWTKIFMLYCDGSLFQGHRKQPIMYKKTPLYFRGSKIMKANLQYIDNKFNLKTAEKVVFSGFSAGGIAVTLWTDYLRTIIENPDKTLYTIPDSSIFMNHINYQTKNSKFAVQLKNLFSVANLDQKSPIQRCNIDNVGEQWRCVLTEFNHRFIEKGKYLFINSEYDSWAIPEILGLKCSKPGKTSITLEDCNNDQMTKIEEYRSQYKQLAYELMNDFSFWSISCSWHVYTILPTYSSPSYNINQTTVKKAVELFVFENQRIVKYDTVDWPMNEGCAY